MKLFFIFIFGVILFAKETILVSILPQKYFIDQLSKEDIHLLIKHGESPITFSLKPKDIEAIKKARIYFTIGVPFEKAWIEKFLSYNPNLKIVDMGKYLKRYPLRGDHHKGLDPHIWLAPPYGMLLARAVLDELLKLHPQKRDLLFKNYQNFIKQIVALDSKIYKVLLAKKTKALKDAPSLALFPPLQLQSV